MVYEKAYASWQKGGGDTPPIQNLTGGNTLTAIQNITAWTNVVQRGMGGTNPTPFADIKAQCDNTTGKALWPMGAWTEAGNPANNIYAHHAYSVLGVYTSGGVNYIVLRDPYGGKKAEPAANVLKAGIWNGIDLSKDDGVIALKEATFMANFWQYGYVKSP